MTALTPNKLHLRHLSFAALTTLAYNDIGAIANFLDFDQSNLTLSSRQADRFLFTGIEQPEPGDLIFFNATLRYPKGQMAIVKMVRSNGAVVIQEMQGDRTVWTNGTYLTSREICLQHSPPYPGYGTVMGWLRLKL